MSKPALRLGTKDDPPQSGEKLCGISRCFHWFLCPRRSDDEDANKNTKSSENGSQAERFAAQKISDQYGYNRIHVGIGADLCRRFMMDEPQIGSEADDGAEDDEVEQREPGVAGDSRGMKGMKLSERCSRKSEEHSSGEH